ncbi:MAG: GNAT family N-acetyltransferase [Clostridiales bacterium]
MIYRDITITDLDDVYNLVCDVFLEFVSFEFTNKGIENFKDSIKPKVIEYDMNNSKKFLIGCFDNGKIVGVISVKNYYHINLLFVSKNYHKKGIAKKLFNEAFKRCINKNRNLTKFTVNSSIFASEVYKKLGFKVIGEKEIVNGISFIPMCMKIKLEKMSEENSNVLLFYNKTLELLNSDEDSGFIIKPSNNLELDYDEDINTKEIYFLRINEILSGMFKVSYNNKFWDEDLENTIYLDYFYIIEQWEDYALELIFIEKIKSLIFSNRINSLRVYCDNELKKITNYFEINDFKVIDTKIVVDKYNKVCYINLYEKKFKDLYNKNMVSDIYKKFAIYYDSYVDHFKEDIPLYLKYINEDNDVLEIGCGTGRILKPLLASNCNVTGIDISEDMLKIANRKLISYINNGKLDLIKLDLSDYRIDRNFDRIFISFYTYNYLLNDKERITFIKNVYSMLKDKGILIIDLFYPRSLKKPEIEDIWFQKSFYSNDIKVILKDKRKLIGDLEERIQQVLIDESIKDEIITYRRYFDVDEIKKTLKFIGFKNIYTQNGYKLYSNVKIKDKDLKNFIVIAIKG